MNIKKVLKIFIMLLLLIVFNSVLYASENKPVISLLGGNGSSDIEGNENNQHNFDYKVTIGSQVYNNTYLKFSYLNEGHLVNHHRDLLGGLASYRIPIWKNLSSEVEMGPVLTFDTTTQNQKQTDDKNFGMLVSVALLYNVGFLGEHTDIRFEWNRIIVPTTYNSNIYLIGIDFSLDGSSAKDTYDGYSITTMLSHFKTNIGSSSSTLSESVDVKKILNKDWSASVGLVHQRDDENTSRSIALTSMFWRDFSLTEALQISTGAGIYYAQNKLDDSSSPVNAIISIQPSYRLSKDSRWSIVGRFSRVVNPTGKNFDADIFGIGISCNL